MSFLVFVALASTVAPDSVPRPKSEIFSCVALTAEKGISSEALSSVLVEEAINLCSGVSQNDGTPQTFSETARANFVSLINETRMKSDETYYAYILTQCGIQYLTLNPDDNKGFEDGYVDRMRQFCPDEFRVSDLAMIPIMKARAKSEPVLAEFSDEQFKALAQYANDRFIREGWSDLRVMAKRFRNQK
jgi:hypothetical protein